MKNGILFLAILVSFAAKAQQKQSLKDLLYSGKLKSDSGTVIRKTDDLATKIDTSTKKAPETPKKATVTITDNPAKDEMILADTAVAQTEVTKDIVAAVPLKSNSRIWKAYTDSLVTALKTEVLSSKKIKKETYYLTVDYEIGTDGQVSINNVLCDPENEFLQNQVKERLLQSPPQLAPTLDSNGQPRKTKRKQNFNVTKE